MPIGESVLDLCKKTRNRMIDEHYPFYAVSAYNLEHIESTKVPTMETDGTSLWINPDHFRSLTPQERLFCYAHEILHCALLHVFRREGRDPYLYNIAADQVVNAILIKDGIGTPPKGIIMPEPRFLEESGYPKSVEHVYAVLEKEGKGDKSPESDKDTGTTPETDEEETPEKGGDDESPSEDGESPPESPTDASDEPGKDDGSCVIPGCPTGTFKDAPGPSEATPEDKSEGDWAISSELALAAQAKMNEEYDTRDRGGDTAPNTDRAVKAKRETQLGWIAKLWQFIERNIPTSITWARPNRRYMALDLYLPSQRFENMPKFGFGVDTSGSISAEWLEVVAYQLSAINTQLRPREIEVVYCNSEIQGVDVFTPDSEVALNAKGGGGTSDMDFWPIIDPYFNDKEGNDKPTAVMIYTDLYGEVPPEPEYPVLWLVPEYSTQPDPPYGETIRVSLYDK